MNLFKIKEKTHTANYFLILIKLFIFKKERKKSHRLEGNIFKSHTVSPEGLVPRENEFSKIPQETMGPIRKSAKDLKNTLS